jgi:hypothetical protein
LYFGRPRISVVPAVCKLERVWKWYRTVENRALRRVFARGNACPKRFLRSF